MCWASGSKPMRERLLGPRMRRAGQPRPTRCPDRVLRRVGWPARNRRQTSHPAPHRRRQTPQQTNSPHTPDPRTHHHQLETSPHPTHHHLPRPNHPLPLTPIHRKTDRLHRAQCSIHRNEANTTNYKSDFPAQQSQKVTLSATRFVHPHSWSQPTKTPTFHHHKAEKSRSQQHEMSYNPKDTLRGASTTLAALLWCSADTHERPHSGFPEWGRFTCASASNHLPLWQCVIRHRDDDASAR